MQRFDEGGKTALCQITLITGQKLVVEGNVETLRKRLAAVTPDETIELWGPSVKTFSIQAGAIASVESR